MKQQTLLAIIRYAVVVLATAAIAVFVIVALSMNIQSLTSQVDSLEKKVLKTEAQLATYQRTMCNSKFVVEDADTVTKYSVKVGEDTRTYQVHTPSDYDSSIRHPVILSFDGIDGSGAQMESYSGLDALPAIIVYPDSLVSKQKFTAWQGAPYSRDDLDDVAFVQKVIADLPSQYCMDTERIFAVGMSNGGSFATIVGCKLGDQIQSVASVSGAYYTSCSSEQRTPSLLVLHSVDDNRVYFNGDEKRGLPQVPAWIQGQVLDRKCKIAVPSVQDTTATYYNWKECTNSSVVRFVVLPGQRHGWITAPQTPGKSTYTTAQYIWSFFEETSPRV